MKKTKTNKNVSAKSQDVNPQEYLVLGHLIKYNLYLLAKSVVFSAVSKSETNPHKAAEIANQVMLELDLDTKSIMNSASQEE